jgi:outer membrane protein OmpA-like peptidoglycan-associated protein
VTPTNAAKNAAGPTIKHALAALFVYLVADHATAAQVLSDRVVILENDARSHTVQHTLITTTAQVTLDLPLSVIPQRTRFGGPERATFTEDNQNNPQRVALHSGSAFTRYRHQYGEAVTSLSEDSYRLQAQSWPDQLEVELEELTPEAIESVQAWVFPATAEVLDWRLIAEEGTTSVTGEWSFEDNTLMWTQTGVAAVELQIDYRINPPDTSAAAEVQTAAQSGPVPETEVAPVVIDIDEDGIPDQRDACLSTAVDVDVLGCSVHEPRILDEVRFSRGNSYLDPAARAQLTRTAKALLQSPDTIWEVAGYTDNAGARSLNRELSTKRAEAARQFLLLRGVPAGSVRAEGYGEQDPIADNATSEGRLINRRIELREWYAGQETPPANRTSE